MKLEVILPSNIPHLQNSAFAHVLSPSQSLLNLRTSALDRRRIIVIYLINKSCRISSITMQMEATNSFSIQRVV